MKIADGIPRMINDNCFIKAQDVAGWVNILLFFFGAEIYAVTILYKKNLTNFYEESVQYIYILPN